MRRRQSFKAKSFSPLSTWLPATGIVGLVIVAYFPALRGGFVWDDISVTDNELLRSLDGLRRIWFSPMENMLEEHYWPLTYSVFWIEYHLWGLCAGWFHAVNILIHAGNCLLLLAVVRRLSLPGAWIAAALFAVHPIHVESVAWIIELKDVLSAMFVLIAFRAYLEFDSTRRLMYYWAAIAAFVLGMLSKSMAASFPALLLIYHWWRQGKLTKELLLDVLPFAGIGLTMAVGDVWLVHSGGSIDWGFSIWQKALIAARASWFYAEKIVIPWPLMAIYPRWDIGKVMPFVLALMALLIVAIAGIWMAMKGHRGTLATLLCFLAALSPILGLIPFGFQQYSLVADRFAYLGSIAPILAIALALSRFGRRELVAIILILCLGLTFHHSALYGNGERLWRENIALNPTAWEAHHHLGRILAERGDNKAGIAELSETLRLKPDYAEAHNNLGLALMNNGELKQAEAQFKQALELKPDYAEGENSLGVYLARQGRSDEARRHFERAVNLKPGFSEAEYNLNEINK